MFDLDRRIFIRKNITFSYVNQASALITAIVLVPVFTRLLGQREYGEWLVISTVVANLYLAASAFDLTLVNKIAEAKTEGERSLTAKIVSNALLLYTGLACVLIGVFTLLASALCRLFISHDDIHSASAMCLLGVLMALALPFRTYLMLLRGLERVFEEQRIGTCINLCRLLAIPAAVLCGLKLLAVSAIYGGTALLGGMIGYLRARLLAREARARPAIVSFHTLGHLIRPSLAFALLGVAGRVGFGIDNLVIGHALGPEQVTRYAVPFGLMLVGTRIYSTLTMALVPTITTMYARNNIGGIRHTLSVLVRISLVYAGAAGIALWVTGRCVLIWWAGTGIYPGARTFGLMILLLIMQVLIEPWWILLVATTQHYGAAAIHTVESVLNLALSLLWVRKWGLSGVIAGTLVARALTSAWYIPLKAIWIMNLHFADIPFASRCPVLAAGIASFTFLAVRSSLFSIVPRPVAGVFVASLFAFAFAYVSFSREERRAAIDQTQSLLRRWFGFGGQRAVREG